MFHKTTPELQDQDQDCSMQDQDHNLQDQDRFWSQTGLVLRRRSQTTSLLHMWGKEQLWLSGSMEKVLDFTIQHTWVQFLLAST